MNKLYRAFKLGSSKSSGLVSKAGFTLIELLVVIAIIGLLASVVLVALNSARQKSRDAKRMSDMSQFAKALELYYNQYNTYPTSAAGAISAKANVLGSPNLVSSSVVSRLPDEPDPNDGSCNPTGPNSNQYYWIANTGTNTTNAYAVTFCLGAATGSYPAGPHTLTQAGIQ